ncbi:hypothetical protein GCM10009414_13510 [Tatumella terrea]|uniref:c-type cytochrome n=1 Tax=Tatumella terrea TaxID=419007 RepID=UPI0031D59F88
MLQHAVRAVKTVALLLLFCSASAMALPNTPQQNYLLKCSGCHDIDGSGTVAGGIPPLPGYIGSFLDDPQGRVYVLHVPGVISAGLDDTELADLLNYVNHKWGDVKARPFTAAEVKMNREHSVADVVKLRREIVSRFVRDGVKAGTYPWP